MDCRVLIVDDEPNIVEGIQTMLNRDMPFCSVVGLAYDGTQAIDMAMALKPDIILTDIRMPGLDGIGMIRQLLDAGCTSRFVILTGYSDFGYAKSAIALGVENYITKPIDKEELFLTIRKICKDIQKQTEDTKEMQGELWLQHERVCPEKIYRDGTYTKRGAYPLFSGNGHGVKSSKILLRHI